jgi:hypothetical protein
MNTFNLLKGGCSSARAVLTFLFMIVMSVAAQAAPPANLIANGDFETGDFTGWTVVPGNFSAKYAINNGVYDPLGPGGPLPPINGLFDAVSDQSGASVTKLQQTINVPDGIFSASLTWNDRVRNFAGLFLDPGQEFRVLILDASNGLLQEVFSTNPGDPLLQVGPNSRSGDITGILQAYGRRCKTSRLAPTNQQG